MGTAIKPVLATVSDIYDTAVSLFPCARVHLVKTDPVALKLQLAPQIPDVRLSNAVHGPLFLEAIQTVALAIIIANRNCTAHTPTPLDPARFSIMDTPLSGLRQFYRIRREKEGKQCKDIVLAYLQSEKVAPVPDELIALGLAPGQMNGSVAEEDCRYFEQAIQGLTLNPPGKAIVHLKERYPSIALFLAQKKLQEMFARPRESSYETILKDLQRQVIGQDIAAKKMASILSEQQERHKTTNIKTSSEKRRHNRVLLFVGPTGVGKTELAKAASKHKKNQFISFHMNQFTSEQAASSLFGSPTGYEGSDCKPHMALAIEKHTAAITQNKDGSVTVRDMVFLFDEFEKAHDKLRQSLLTLFDEAYFKIQYTERRTSSTPSANIAIEYFLEDCVIISTSNLCQETIERGFQEGKQPEAIIEDFKTSNRALPEGKKFSNELLGRVKVVPFGPIRRGGEYQKLLKMKLIKFLNELQEDLGCKQINLINIEGLLRMLEENLYGTGTDIRKVLHYFSEITDKIQEVKATWGDIELTKLTFSPLPEQKKVKLTVSTFSGIMGDYIEAPIQPLII